MFFILIEPLNQHTELKYIGMICSEYQMLLIDQVFMKHSPYSKLKTPTSISMHSKCHFDHYQD